MKDFLFTLLGIGVVATASYFGVVQAFKNEGITVDFTMRKIIEVVPEMGGDNGYYQDGEFVPACTEPIK